MILVIRVEGRAVDFLRDALLAEDQTRGQEETHESRLAYYVAVHLILQNLTHLFREEGHNVLKLLYHTTANMKDLSICRTQHRAHRFVE